MMDQQRKDLPFQGDETVYAMFDGNGALVRGFFDRVDEQRKVFEFPRAIT